MRSPDAMLPRAAPARAARTRNPSLAGWIAAGLLAGLAGCAQILGIEELGQRNDAGPGELIDAREPDGGGAAPPAPVLRQPMNGSRVGALFLLDSRRPTFAWEPSASATGYVIEYGVDSTFTSGVTRVETFTTSHRPDMDLPVALARPVGARYYWRVSACMGSACSEPTAPWYLDVGRRRHDLNGDGYDDLLVGAPQDEQGAFLGGAVHGFLGGPGTSFDIEDDGRIVSITDSEQLGQSVAMGDFNGDGFADAVAGAPFFNNERGRLHVHPGGAEAPDTFGAPVVTIVGPAVEVSFAISLATGDFNGDGFDDLAAGDVGPGSNVDQVGHVSVYLGGPDGLDGAADVTLNGFVVGDGLGSAVAGAGDVNGDGFDDLAVGVPGNQRVYLYYGGPDVPFDVGDLLPAIITAPGLVGFGALVTGAGDVDGDGYHDVLVASPAQEAVHLYRGGPDSFDTQVDAVLMAEPQSGLGTAMGAGGDVNGDGFADFFLAKPGAGLLGEVALYLGSPVPPNAPFTGMGGTTGAGMSEIADFNGDGLGDIAVSNAGVDIYLGGDLLNAAEARLESTAGGFGASVAP
jgi:hypothetical protein